MQIILPGALPPSTALARQLAQQLPNATPILFAWMNLARAQSTPFDPRHHGCTPFEGWQLEQAGFQPQPDQPLGAGLGPLRASPTAALGETVWLADLVHLAIGLDRVTLLPAQWLDLTPAQGHALFEAACPLFQDTAFAATLLTPYRWRIQVPASFLCATMSPEAVMGTSLAHGWQQHTAVRSWRHLLNMIQMLWHDHPVNHERLAQGQQTINGLWLYGGGKQGSPRFEQTSSCQVIEDLLPSFLTENWHDWLEIWTRLDNQIFKSLCDPAKLPTTPLTLRLFGHDRQVVLTIALRHRLLRWLPFPKQNWSAWWFPPN